MKDSNTGASGQTLDPEDSDTFAPINITGGTVRVRVREIGETTILKTITASITDASGGKVAMLFPSDTFPALEFMKRRLSSRNQMATFKLSMI